MRVISSLLFLEGAWHIIFHVHVIYTIFTYRAVGRSVGVYPMPSSRTTHTHASGAQRKVTFTCAAAPWNVPLLSALLAIFAHTHTHTHVSLLTEQASLELELACEIVPSSICDTSSYLYLI